jgi:hypothetical protein
MKIINVVAGVVAALVLAGCSSSGDEAVDDDAAVDYAPVTSEVVYEVEGDPAYAEVTLETPTGSTQVSPDLPMGFKDGGKLTYTFSPGDFVYISAQNPDEYGSVTCRITVNGEVISENTASGSYAIATCKGHA